MRHRGAVLGEQRDFIVGQVHRMHRDQARPEQSQALQPLDRTHAVLG